MEATANASPDAVDPAWSRLEEQLDWYDRKSIAAQRAYKDVKIAQLAAAAAVPVLAAADVPKAWIAGVSALLVVLAGLQQLYQWQTNWVLDRSTAEALKHERYLYLGHAGPYGARNRHRVLAERIEGLVSQEHARWTQAQDQTSERSNSGLHTEIRAGWSGEQPREHPEGFAMTTTDSSARTQPAIGSSMRRDRVFVSYAHGDRSNADTVEEGLRSLDKEVWIGGSLSGGQPWWDARFLPRSVVAHENRTG